MSWQTPTARGFRQHRRTIALWLITAVWLLGSSARAVGAAPPSSVNPIAAARVASDSGLNMRTAPQMGAAVLRVLPFLAEVHIVGQAIESDGHQWVPIQLKPEQGGQQGWAARRWLVALPLGSVGIQSGGSSGTGLLSDPQRLRLIKGSSDAQYAALGGTRYHVADLDTLAALNLGGYEQVSDNVLASLREGPRLRLHPGGLLRDDAGRVWLIGNDRHRHWIPNLATFVTLGYMWEHVQQTPNWAVHRLPMGEPVVPPQGTVEQAITWSQLRVGHTRWNRLCEQFVEGAYGTSKVYLTAWRARQALVVDATPGGLDDAPVGALLFFRPDQSNDYDGHVGLHLGNGHMISATYTGVRETDVVQDQYWLGLYAGWGYPSFPA